MSLTPTVSYYTTDTTYTGYSSTQTINPQELNLWRVISLNDDGTVDIISEHVSSTAVYFSGFTGYENSTYTVGSRYFGYNGQTEYITELFVKQFEVPWTCSTSYDECDAEESRGGADTLYLNDYNLVNTVLGTERATNLSGDDTGYWIASRYYKYDSSTDASWSGRSVVTWSSVGDNPRSSSLFYRESSGHMDTSASNALRPILTLKLGLNYSGSGTENNPGVPMAS